MPRPGAWGCGEFGHGAGFQFSGLRTVSELEDDVGAGVRHEGEPLRWVEAHGMRLVRSLDELVRLGTQGPVRPEGVDRDLTPDVVLLRQASSSHGVGSRILDGGMAEVAQDPLRPLNKSTDKGKRLRAWATDLLTL